MWLVSTLPSKKGWKQNFQKILDFVAGRIVDVLENSIEAHFPNGMEQFCDKINQEWFSKQCIERNNMNEILKLQ